MSSTENAAPPTKSPVFGQCWSCRILGGTGLIGSGAYVYSIARSTMKRGGPVGMGTVAQISFAMALLAWGVTIIVDPVGKAKRIDE
ncbi:distal membrane-arm assembly complex protein 1 [Xenopus laevis]|uniref:Distal membrane-arm assembly complex protein 1 n=2 Tax=Xenopus laevis TaxID=8355 RepID=A0A1L8GJY3_XENLA|nr:distal membrane-arm assembly complex protein 1 [Xenopus laevis]OCT84123.1 hypothetical protein XELAEV_18022263mg [Xenopus laevis]